MALTGWGQEEDRRRTREASFDLHLVKPVDGADLIKILASVLGDATTHPHARLRVNPG
jgi:CheY-like chemotaxis protein